MSPETCWRRESTVFCLLQTCHPLSSQGPSKKVYHCRWLLTQCVSPLILMCLWSVTWIWFVSGSSWRGIDQKFHRRSYGGFYSFPYGPPLYGPSLLPKFSNINFIEWKRSMYFCALTHARNTVTSRDLKFVVIVLSFKWTRAIPPRAPL